LNDSKVVKLLTLFELDDNDGSSSSDGTITYVSARCLVVDPETRRTIVDEKAAIERRLGEGILDLPEFLTDERCPK